MEIRKAVESDAIKIAAVAIAVWIDTYAEKGMDDLYAAYVLGRFTELNVMDLIRSKTVYVAETEFGICGFSVVGSKSEARYEIETMYVLSMYQSKSVGARLLEVICRDILGPFWLKCAEYNPRALSFYRRNGFADAGMVNFVLDGKDYPCVLLNKIT
jgi:GNAT superfamily N-acetyltransferase